MICPFCNQDPFDYADVGIGSIPIGITCCGELVHYYYSHNEQFPTSQEAETYLKELYPYKIQAKTTKTDWEDMVDMPDFPSWDDANKWLVMKNVDVLADVFEFRIVTKD